MQNAKQELFLGEAAQMAAMQNQQRAIFLESVHVGLIKDIYCGLAVANISDRLGVDVESLDDRARVAKLVADRLMISLGFMREGGK